MIGIGGALLWAGRAPAVSPAPEAARRLGPTESVVPLVALAAARVAPPPRDPEPLPYLRDDGDWALDLALEVRLNGQVISRPPFRTMYWTPAQLLAHTTVNGAPRDSDRVLARIDDLT